MPRDVEDIRFWLYSYKPDVDTTIIAAHLTASARVDRTCLTNGILFFR
jgi:hypothetical protein